MFVRLSDFFCYLIGGCFFLFFQVLLCFLKANHLRQIAPDQYNILLLLLILMFSQTYTKVPGDLVE